MSNELSNVRVHYLDTVSSTNDVAKKCALAGEEEGLVIVAENQTHGKGRWGRRWQSPKGGLWFTILLRPPSLEHLGLISLAAGIASVRTIECFGVSVNLKWPNDIIFDGRKLGGILIEGGTQGDSYYALVGIGINLNIPKDAFSEDIRETATSLLELTSCIIPKDSFLNTLLGHFFKLYKSILSGQTNNLLEEYRRACSSIGKKVRVETLQGTIDGTVVGIAHDGALLLDICEGLTRKIQCGEVTSLRGRTVA
ncbi:MAG: biotin--[acetyl-CoA-carboxylase] ligase [Candidatus Bathyarchaeia archaeon]